MPKTAIKPSSAAIRAAIRRGWVMRGMADRRGGDQVYPMTSLSAYGTQMQPQQPLPLLVGDGRGSSFASRIRNNLWDYRPYRIPESQRSIDSLEGMLDVIQEEMYDQEEKARRDCVVGEETALRRYQAMNDLLADLADVIDDVRINPAGYD